MTSVNNTDKTPVQIVEEQRLKDEADAKAKADQERQAANGQTKSGFLSVFGNILGMLLKAILGAFSDSKSEYSEIDETNAQHTGWGKNAFKVAGSFTEEHRVQLEALSKKYEGKHLANISPLEVQGTVSSTLGHRERPVQGASTDHKGIDIIAATPTGAPVKIHNTMPGIVIRSETQRDKNGNVAGFGNWVEVACIDGTRRRYAHLKSSNVHVGDVLDQGALIGIMGNTGTHTKGAGNGVHLHYEWRDADGVVLAPQVHHQVYALNDISKKGSHIAASHVQPENHYAGLVDKANLPKLPVKEGQALNSIAAAPFKPVSSQRGV